MKLPKIKFFIKWTLMGSITRLFLFCFGMRANHADSKDRILIIDLHGIGDVILATPVLRYYREYFKGKQIYFLVTKQTGFTRETFDGYIDHILMIDVRKFGINPWYALKEINKLRAIGFHIVVNECLGIKEKASRVISVSIGANVVIGYEGPGIELADDSLAEYQRYAEHHIFPLYSKLVSSVDKGFKNEKSKPENAIKHHLAICSAVTGREEFDDISPIYRIDASASTSAMKKLVTLGYRGGKYVVLIMGANDLSRRWGVDKFSKVASYLNNRGYEIVLLGSPSERYLGDMFKVTVNFPFINAAGGEVSVVESGSIIDKASCLIANDTGPIHIAIALKVPSLCIAAAGLVRMNGLYGYRGINKWIYKDIGCLDDNMRCARNTPNMAAPCLLAIEPDDVIHEFSDLERFMSTGKDDTFSAGF